MLNAEVEDEIECVFMCVFEGVVAADKIHMNSSHVLGPSIARKPRPPSPRRDAALPALSYQSPSLIDSPFALFFVALHRWRQSCTRLPF